jgi:hypothetical protein
VKRLSSLKDDIALLIVGVITAGVIVFALGLWLHFSTQPPKESTTIANFYRHRAQYDQLRDMLLSDNSLVEVTSSGVRTPGSPITTVPPEGRVSLDRFHQYLALLGEIGGKSAYQTQGKHPEVVVSAWVAGWAGDTRHVNICWREDEPTNPVMSLDEFYRTPDPRKPVYRHIEGNWYIWAD